MKYAIITPMPYTIVEDNLYIVDELWGTDLEAHLNEFENLHVFAPFVSDNFKTRLNSTYIFSKQSTIKFHPLPYSTNIIGILLSLPKVIYLLNSQIKSDDIIHSTGTSFPPYGILANLWFYMKGYKYRIFVLDADLIKDLEIYILKQKKYFKRYLVYFIKTFYYNIFKTSIRLASLTFLVGDELFQKYNKYGTTYKIYPSWVKKENIISELEMNNKFNSLLQRKEFRIIFAASLITKKNPMLSLEVIKILLSKKHDVILNIYGSGPLESEIRQYIEKNKLDSWIKLKGNVAYKSFSDVLKNHDAIIIPNLSGETPRIVFDAFANGTAVVASDIKSFQELIKDSDNGMLCNSKSPECFACAIEKMILDKILLKNVIESSIRAANIYTIESMHEKRRIIINKCFKIEKKT